MPEQLLGFIYGILVYVTIITAYGLIAVFAAGGEEANIKLRGFFYWVIVSGLIGQFFWSLR